MMIESVKPNSWIIKPLFDPLMSFLCINIVDPILLRAKFRELQSDG